MFFANISKSKAQWAVLVAAMLLTLPAAFAAGSNQSGAYLGVHIGDITPDVAASLKLNDISGVVVQSLDHDGPACKAGIRNNDIIVAVAGTKIHNAEQMVELMQTMAAGSVADISIVRDGRPQDVKVTLASRKNWMAPNAAPMPNNSSMAKAFAGPMPSVAYPADVDVPLMTPASARRGIVVEGLTAQLAEFFGVSNGQGVLVRNVQRGSQGANAGLKAGDIIIKIDGQPIRDLADWRRSMNISTGKTSFSIIREKREQVVEMVMPGNSGELRLGDDWDSFGLDMNAFNRQMELLRPEFQRQTEQAMMFRSDELEKMQREIEKSVRKDDKELKHQAREIQKSMKDLEPQLRKQTEEIQKQMEQMRPGIEKQTQAAREQMQRMQPELQKQVDEIAKAMTLKQEDIEKMRHEIDESMQAITPQIQEQMKLIGPQIQQQMQQLQKEMQQHQHEWQDMMKNLPNSSGRPNQF
jgi:serine protease Do